MKKCIYLVIVVGMILCFVFGNISVAAEPKALYEGDSGDLHWSIDGNGLLTIEGTGDYELVRLENNGTMAPAWIEYNDMITSVKFNVSDITSTEAMFLHCIGLESIDLIGLDLSKIKSMRKMFWGCDNLEEIDFSKCTNINTAELTDMYGLFASCRIKTVDLSAFNTSNVKDMGNLFSCCWDLEEIDLSDFDTQNVINMEGMFDECKLLQSIDVSNFDTGNVNNMYEMFRSCEKLETLDVGNFNTKNVENMNRLFAGCINLKKLNISQFDTSNVTDISCMFLQCENLESINVSNFDTGKVTDMKDLFSYCYKLEKLDISNFNIQSNLDIENLLTGCKNLKMFIIPANLSQSIYLDSDEGYSWYDESGVEKTKTDQYLNYSMTYTKIKTLSKATNLSLSEISLSMMKGDSKILIVSFVPEEAEDKNVVWTTSDANVAAVTDGKVTATGVGNAIITVETIYGIKAECTVNVSEANVDEHEPQKPIEPTAPVTPEPPTKEEVKVTKISISGISKKIAAGKKMTLTAKVTPDDADNKEVTWSSSNKKYATVSSKGVVTTKKAGAGKSVTITATAKDGSGIKAKYKISIMKHAVKNVKFTAKTKTVKAGKKLTLKATVKTTGNKVNKALKWTSSNTKYATVSSKGVVTAKKAGKGKKVKITAQATDGTGKKATVTIHIK